MNAFLDFAALVGICAAMVSAVAFGLAAFYRWIYKAEPVAPPVQSEFTFPVPLQFAEWTAADVEIWRAFLSNPTGAKLVAICGQHALQQAMKEAQGDALAQAAGMDALLTFQFNLASDRMHARLSEAAADSAANHATAGEQDDAAAVESRSF